jgi:hypothetical protein
MMPMNALSVRKLLRIAFLAAIGGVATWLAIMNLIAFDKQARFFAAAELSLAIVMSGALVHEIRAGGWRPAGR